MARARTAAPAWLTTDELAERLHIPVTTIYRWRTIGYGPQGVRMGKYTRFRQADVEKFEAELLKQASA